jgi:phosphatidylserine/phosphatidylglycerophosphate/cardiolipin synthase-like enzyme
MAIDIHWFLPAGSGTFSQRWPYGPGTPFHPDLAIEIDATFRTQPAVAPASGTLVILPDVSLNKTCSVLLIPHVEVRKALAADGIGEVVFYLRTLDLDDLVKRFKASVTAKLPRGVTADKQIANLKAGKVPLLVDSGDDIALVAPETPGQAKGLVQFEVIYAPRRGSYVGIARAIVYAKRLTDPANRYRRLDPMAFYYRVKRGVGFQTRIAPAHAAHPFWTSTSLTRRGLIELRNEYDRPFPTSINLTVQSAPATSVTLQDANWTHHEVAAPGTTGLVDLKLEKSSWRLTRLPTSGRSFTSQTNQEEVPFHFPVQSIYMAPTASTDSWFVPNDAPLSFFTEKNEVQPLVDGIDTYKVMVSYLQRVRHPEEFAWLAGWWCTHDFEMIPTDASSTLLELVKPIDAANADFRVILWDQTGHRKNKRTVEAVSALPFGNAFGILDNQTRAFGSHHQKFMVVYLKPDDSVVFCGGIDVNPNRIDNPDHSLRWAYHDTHAQLQGPVVRDFMRLFIERWNDHQSVIQNPGRALPSPPNWVINDTAGDCFVQVTRTMPRGTHNSVKQGIQGTFKAVQRAVQRAQHYIYIEEQYLVPYYGHVPFDPTIDFPGNPGIVQDLLDALKRIEFLLIVIPNYMMTPQVLYRRREFLEALARAAGPNASKIHVYFLKRKKPGKEPAEVANETELEENDMMSRGDISATKAAQKEFEIMGGSGASGGRGRANEIYCHTKVWIVDDVYVKCGSMNVNRRGFTYDSEADFHAVDGAVTRGKRRAALAFKQALFSEHTRLTPDEVPEDPRDMINWWLDRAASSGRVGKYDWNRYKIPPLMKTEWDFDWRTVIDPDGR